MLDIIKIRYLISILFINFFIFNSNVYSLDIDNIVAYPVPFIQKKHHILRIGYKPGITNNDNIDKVKVEIYDINGDKVFTKEYSSLSVIWNGRNSKGKIVKAGLYFLKIIIEDSAVGGYGKKIIRILINN